MDKKLEQIPAIIFDWLETLDFIKLNASQQAETLKYFSKEEYREMRNAFLDIKTLSIHNKITNSINREGFLLAHFDKHYANKKVLTPIFVWRVAALLLLLLSGGLFFKVLTMKDVILNPQVALVDTVYVNKDVKSTPEIIHDTVYITKQLVVKKNDGQGLNYSYSENNLPTTNLTVTDMSVISFKDRDNRANKVRGNSMKDDSLYRKHGFVSM